MKRAKRDSSLSLPEDLIIIDILTKLPAKSVCKFICVSKFWLSTIQSKIFTGLYLTRPLARPRPRLLLFQFDRSVDMRFFHSTLQENPSSDSKPVSITTRNPLPGFQLSPPVRGLLCSGISEIVISNPCTGQTLILPKVKTDKEIISSFFGYDPVNDLYKVLCMTVIYVPDPHFFSEEHQVFTLGSDKNWRMIECKHPQYCPVSNGLCKNGVIYYGAFSSSLDVQTRSLVMSFDLRSEEFNPIALPIDVQFEEHNGEYRLVNYNGKIALVNQPRGGGSFEFWVLDDLNKQEWSKVSVLVPSWRDLTGERIFFWKGTISTGELIFAPRICTDQFFVIYYDPKERKARRVEMEVTGSCFIGMTFFLDHVESPMFLPRNDDYS